MRQLGEQISPSLPSPQLPCATSLGDNGGAYSGPPVLPAHRVLGTGAQGRLMARGSPQQGLVPLALRVPYSEARGHSKLWASAGAPGQRLASSNSSLRCLGFLTGVEKAFLVKMVLLLSTYLWQLSGHRREESVKVALAGPSSEMDGLTSSPWKK